MRSGRVETRPRAGRSTVSGPRAGLWRETFAALAVAATLATTWSGGSACAPAGSGSGGHGAQASPGDVVGLFELAAPSVGEFILHGTLPVPPGTYTGAPGETAFQVVDSDGSRVAAQTEIVSRYPDAADGADVVEVLARVRLAPGTAPGTRVYYAVIYQPKPAPVFRSDPQVHAFLEGPGGIVARARDVFGNEYAADLWLDAREGTGSLRVLKDGSQAIQKATHESLLPVSPTSGPSGTLPHLMGVHAYVTEWAREPYFTLDLRVHDAHSGHDPNDPSDDALGKIYFESFEIVLPQGWIVMNAFDDPYVGAPYDEGSMRVWPVVAPVGPSAGNAMHVMPAMSQFHRRLVVAREESLARAQSAIVEEGLAFCRAGPSPSGGDLWSWWNPYTARYFPQRQRLPSLDHVGLDTLRAQDQSRLGVRAQQVHDGSTGPWPSESPGLGWAHPWGITDGGMVSGFEIHLYDGVTTACAASVHGYRFAQIVHRMLTDRQRSCMFNADGLPTRMEDWVVHTPNGDLLPVWWYGGPMLWATDPFGITSSPSFQRDAVAGLGLQPPWEGALLAYQSIDLAHLIRYTRMAKVLAWLGNDAIAKDDLRCQAENMRMGYNMYRQDSYPQGVVSTGMLADRIYVNAHPGWGFSFGRGEGWGLDTMSAAYSLGDPAWRTDVRPWFDQVLDLLRDGQMDCTGIMQATWLGNVFNGQYRCRQSIEAAITENAIVSMRESVYRYEDNGRTNQANDVLKKMAYAMISPLVWDEVGHGPWAMMAVGIADVNQPPFCNYIPDDGNYGFPDHALPWNTYAYGYQLTHDGQFLNKATEEIGGNLVAECYAMGANEIENRAALLALVQTF